MRKIGTLSSTYDNTDEHVGLKTFNETDDSVSEVSNLTRNDIMAQ